MTIQMLGWIDKCMYPSVYELVQHYGSVQLNNVLSYVRVRYDWCSVDVGTFQDHYLFQMWMGSWQEDVKWSLLLLEQQNSSK
jgi:hypothetical protein